MLLKGDKPKDFVVKLQRCATITGRLLDADGKPLAEKALSGSIFRIEGLIPGVTISARLLDGTGLGGNVFENLSPRSGEMKDLGDITINTRPEDR